MSLSEISIRRPVLAIVMSLRHRAVRRHGLLFPRRARVSGGGSADRDGADDLSRRESGRGRLADHRAAGAGHQRHRRHPHALLRVAARSAAPSPSSSRWTRIWTPRPTTCATGSRAPPAACRWMPIRRWWKRRTRIPRRSCSSRSPATNAASWKSATSPTAVVRERMETIPGVSSVRIFGEKRYAMRLWMDPVKLAVHRLTPADVQAALDAQNVDLPSGRLEGATNELSLRTLGRLSTAGGFRQPHHQAGKRPADPLRRHRQRRTRSGKPAHRLQERPALSDRRGDHPPA